MPNNRLGIHGVMILVFLLSPTSIKGIEFNELSQSCASVDEQRVQGNAMLQKHLSKTAALQSMQEDLAMPMAEEQPFTEEEFNKIQTECCLHSFDQYSRSIIQLLELDICDEGCHNGFIPFLYCGQAQTLQDLKNQILAKSRASCPCYALSGLCAPGGMPAACLEKNTGSFNPSWHGGRPCQASTTTGAGADANASSITTTTIPETTTSTTTTTITSTTTTTSNTTSATTTTTTTPTTTTSTSDSQAMCDTYTFCSGDTPVNKGSSVQCSGNADSCDASTCCEAQATCDTYSSCSGDTPVNKGSSVQCLGNADSCDASTCCEAQATCDTYSSCSGDTPVNKGSSVQCSGNADSCDASTCCEAQATCDTYSPCSGDTPVNKGSSVQCSGNADSCDTSTCCEAQATCDAYSPCSGDTPVNKGSSVQCSGNADSCDTSTCCEAQATCDTYSSCSGDTPVNKGSSVQCSGNADSCDASTCCEAQATCDAYSSCSGGTPVNKGSSVQCSGNVGSCDASTCCEADSTTTTTTTVPKRLLPDTTTSTTTTTTTTSATTTTITTKISTTSTTTTTTTTTTITATTATTTTTTTMTTTTTTTTLTSTMTTTMHPCLASCQQVNASLLALATSLCTEAMQCESETLDTYLPTCQCAICDAAKSRDMNCTYTGHEDKEAAGTVDGIPGTGFEAAKDRCMLLGESQCKAVSCRRYNLWGPREQCHIKNTTTLIDREEEQDEWTTYIPESECFLVPQYYEEPAVVAARYSVCGEPQCSNATKEWAKRECSIVIQECGGVPEDVPACVEDICSLVQAGYSDAINLTDAYCDPFGERNETNPTPDPDSSTTTTTRGSAWCSGESGTGITSINSFSDCAMPPTYEQCNAYALSRGEPGARRGAFYDKTSIPSGCFKFYSFNVGWIGFNSLQHSSTYWDNDYTKLCCGTEVVTPTTTTTTPKPWVFLPPPTSTCCTKPPLQPNNKSDPLDDLDFRDQIERTCKIHNDPHIDRFDGRRVSFFSVGNYWLVNSRDLWIQSRFLAIGSNTPGRSFGVKLAIGGPLLEGNTMMFEETLQYWWNDQLMIPNMTVATYMNGKVTASFSHAKYLSVQLPFGISLKMRSLGPASFTSVSWLQVRITMRPLKDMDGFCGDGDKILESAADVIAKWGQKIPAGSSQALIPY